MGQKSFKCSTKIHVMLQNRLNVRMLMLKESNLSMEKVITPKMADTFTIPLQNGKCPRVELSGQILLILLQNETS